MTDLRLGAGLLAGVALMASGCGLISSDITDINMNLPAQKFAVDTADWQVDGMAAMQLLSTDCSGAPQACGQAAEAACEMDCSATCNGSTSTCDLSLDVGLYAMIDLLKQAPELMAVDDQPVIDVTIGSVKYVVPSNSLSVDTPPLDIYVAPMTIMDPTDPEAKHIGTIPAVAANSTLGSTEIEFTASGKAELAKIMSTFKTPFNVLVGANIVVTSGQMVPTGKLDAEIQITATASAN